MIDYTDVQCLFCETGKEEKVVNAIHDHLWGRAIFAQRVRYIWREKEWIEVKAPLLPGYVFVYMCLEGTLNINYRSIPHVIRVLNYENGIDKLMGSDLAFADWLWRINGVIDVLKAVQIGDRVEIADSALRELKGTILRLNKRQKKMLVSLDTQSIPIRVWLSYSLIDVLKEKG